MELEDGRGAMLAGYARAVIKEALGGPRAIPPSGEWVDQPAATFVTLHRGEELHGCMGTMEPRMTLVDSVAHNARAAALKDPRAPRIDIDEVDDLSVEVSLLSPLERLSFTDEASLLAQLRPGVDGLLLSWRGHHGTFLPQVWESLPEPRLFLSQLKRKAWLPVDFWAPDVTIERYTVQKWIDPAPLRRRAAG